MYAVTFDLDTGAIEEHPDFKGKYHEAYGQIRTFLTKHGFDWKQGSVYFGKENVINAASCVLIIQKLGEKYPWFASSVRDIRMLRIEENNDLRPAVTGDLPSPLF